MQFIFVFIVSLVITMLLVPPLIKLAPVIGAVDLPDNRKVHILPIPRIGGVAMIVGVIVPILFWLPFNNQIFSLIIAYLILLFFGVWDDRSDINFRIKFLGQLIAVLVVVVIGDVVITNVPFIDSPLPDYVSVPFTVFALVGITNAINLSDGLDGLAGGTTLLTFCMIGFIGYKSNGIEIVVICMAVAGALIGFLRHNTYPARIFMGDTGSQFLGFSAGVMVIVLSQQTNQAMSPVIPLILLGLPILDTVTVMCQRLYERRSPFSADKNHIHHKLLGIGFDHYEAVFIIYLVQAGLVALAYLLRYESDILIMFIYIVFSASCLYVFYFAGKTGWRLRSSAHACHESYIVSWVDRIKRSGMLDIIPINVLKIGIPLLFFTSVFISNEIKTDIGILSILVLTVISISIVTNRYVSIVEKFSTYMACVLTVYLLESNISIYLEYSNFVIAYFVIIAISFALKVRYSKDRAFQITPLDFLVVLLVIVVPNLPELSLDEINLGDAAIKLIILFYACEAVLNISKGNWGIFRFGLISTLMFVSIRGFI